MPLILLALLLFVVLAFGGVILLSLAARYRAGTSRRQGRRWVATMNMWMTSLSALFFLFSTSLMSFWVPQALKFALVGMSLGALLGMFGLAFTRWETGAGEFFYTPSRWLALFITLVITARFAYGWWGGLHAGSAPGEQHWVIAGSNTQLSLAVAAGLIGYYLVYAIGLRFRLVRHERRRVI